MSLIDFSQLKDALSPFAKILDTITKHWFREMLLMLGMTLILFATQLAIVPLDTVNNGFNIFIALAVIGFAIYWYLLSNIVGLLLSALFAHFTKVNEFMAAYNLLGLIIGAFSLILSTLIVFPFAHYWHYSVYWHVAVAILAHICLFYCMKKLIVMIANLSKSLQQA